MRYAWGILAGVFMTGCAASGPSLTVLPGQGKSFEQFQTDDGACRNAAAGQDQRRYDMLYVQCMYAKGHRVPAFGGWPYLDPSSQPPTRPPANLPTPPQGTPPAPPPGTTR